MKNSGSMHKVIHGGSSVVGIIIFLAIIIGLQYIAINNPIRWDMTHEKQHTLSPQSLRIMEQFKEKNEPVEILAFYESKDQKKRVDVSDLIDRYRDVWSGLSYSFYDPDKDRAMALQNKIDSYPTTVVKSLGKTERISSVDEESLTNALLKLQRNETKKIYFLKGHGELSSTSTDQTGLSIARERILKQNYVVDDLLLLQASEVPSDAAVLIIAGPRTDLMAEELRSIDRFLARGGAIMVMMNPFQGQDFARNLSHYGFELSDDIVVDRMSQALGGDYLMPVITSYAPFPITRNFDVASFFPQARSVRQVVDLPENIRAVELAFTSPASWTISESQLMSGSAEFDEKMGQKGPIPVMAVSTISSGDVVSAADQTAKETKDQTGDAPKPDDPTKADDKTSSIHEKTTKKSRVVVFGSSQFASNKFFKLQGNGDLFMNTVSWLAEDENLISISPRSIKAQPVVLTADESMIALVVPVILTPLVVVIAGVVVFFYRRRTSAA